MLHGRALNFLDRLSKKYSNTKIYENPSSWSPSVPRGGRTEHDEANGRFSKNFVKVPKN